MTKEQMIHISMVNSYNVITNRATIEQVTNSGIGVFCHSPEEKDGMESINFMISYFQNLEMYEKCSDLKKYVNDTFNTDGTYKEKLCECSYPDIQTYTPIVKCSVCNLMVKR
jgi:hypothetical protein